MFIDTHLHLSYKEGVKPDEFIEHAKKCGIDTLIVSCCSKESIIEGLELVKKFDNLYLSVGFHPEEVLSVTNEDILWLESIIKSSSKIVALGEIGLDYYWEKDQKQEQISLFRKQLELAKKFDLPVVIHTREAIQETYDILSEYSLRGVIHCYSGSYEMAERFIELGYFLGIGGVVTFSNSKLYQVVERVGLSHILLETDSPYLAPVPNRGKVNESSNIYYIAEHISKILSVSIEEVGRITSDNARYLFDLPSDL